MHALQKQFKQKSALASFALMLIISTVSVAENERSAEETYLRAREMTRKQEANHAVHTNDDKSKAFRGVFYGFLPCDNCLGIKMTLSLKQNNNYLLVTQNAKESSREYYEKGKYDWDDEKHVVTLTPNEKSDTRQYHIDNDDTLIQLNSDGTRLKGGDVDRYALKRSDIVKAREQHFH
jgi:hypothetical protein